MGGDRGSDVVIDAAIVAATKHSIPVVIVGDSNLIERRLKSKAVWGEKSIALQHASQTVEMSDSPAIALRSKPDSSIRVAFNLAKNKLASAVVSTGNTGAMMAAGLLVSGTIAGIDRPAIGTLIPRLGRPSPTLLIDSGANVDCHADQLLQFALMGACFYRAAFGEEQPRIALLSNGSEPSKGNDLLRAASALIAGNAQLNYCGYVEGRDITADAAEVVVCDGFVGNIVLKTLEGGASFVMHALRNTFKRGVRGRLSAMLARPLLRSFHHEVLDPSAYGGAPLLGLNHTAMVCHGSADQRAVENAIRLASQFVSAGLVAQISEAVEQSLSATLALQNAPSNL